ncbi:Aspartic peptidase [Gossypium australe]|uniref:Aspartic peptidase n=1 Tax=Gossypium australe TaxID=47621 RepID=A0A5B6VAZ7_9ROSI|nr:Aspartic peptidase [Gossypium australe]
MCDLGTSINVMPLLIYKLLNAGLLKEICVIIPLADRSLVHPEEVLEDVLVKVNKLIFPPDFYIIDMEDDIWANSSDILLERPFLSTVETNIGVRSGIFTMEFHGEVVKFNVYEAMNRPSMISNVFILPSGLQTPELELKPLSNHLKYAFFVEGNTLTVIILSKLSKVEEEEENLVQVLRYYKEVIGWTINDVKGLSPLTCVHKISVERM